MPRDLNLTGGEISMIKALGLGGTPMYGKMLIERVEMVESEFVDVMTGLIDQDYVLSSKVNVMKMEDVEHSYFRVNPSYGRELRNALRGRKREEDKPRRRRA
jgi:hypothetical protein